MQEGCSNIQMKYLIIVHFRGCQNHCLWEYPYLDGQNLTIFSCPYPSIISVGAEKGGNMSNCLNLRSRMYRQSNWSNLSSNRALKGMPIHLTVNQECETRLLSVFASLRRCRECGPHTKSEIYLGSVYGHMCFLPGPPWKLLRIGAWSLNLESLQVAFWTTASDRMLKHHSMKMCTATAR